MLTHKIIQFYEYTRDFNNIVSIIKLELPACLCYLNLHKNSFFKFSFSIQGYLDEFSPAISLSDVFILLFSHTILSSSINSFFYYQIRIVKIKY